MPYTKFKKGGRYCIKNKKTGKKTCFGSEEKRKTGVRIREAYAHGWRPKRKTSVKKHSRKINGSKVKVKAHKRKVKGKPIIKKFHAFPFDRLTTDESMRAGNESDRFLFELKDQEFKDEPNRMVPELARANLLSSDFADKVNEDESKSFFEGDDQWLV